jgi:hypothetical protein
MLLLLLDDCLGHACEQTTAALLAAAFAALLQAGDGHSDQMVLLSGPPGDPFLDVHNFNGAQVCAGLLLRCCKSAA